MSAALVHLKTDLNKLAGARCIDTTALTPRISTLIVDVELLLNARRNMRAIFAQRLTDERR